MAIQCYDLHMNWIWLSGLFEGEGSVYIQKVNHKNGRIYYDLNVEIGMTDKQIINYLKKELGGRLNLHAKEDKDKNRDTSWKWNISSVIGKKFLEDLLPYIGTTHNIERIKLGIEFQSKKTKKVKAVERENYRTFQEECFLKMQKLNERGYGTKHLSGNSNFLEKIDLNWLAGLFEGEGSIQISKVDRKNRWMTYRLYVEVRNTNKELMDYLQSNLAGTYLTKKTDKDKNRREAYIWQLGAGKANPMLASIRSYVFSDRVKEKIDLALEFQNQKQIGGLRGNTEYGKKQEEYFLKMKELNKRGYKGE